MKPFIYRKAILFWTRPSLRHRSRQDARRARIVPEKKNDNSLGVVVQWYLDHRDWADLIRSSEYNEFYVWQYGAQ